MEASFKVSDYVLHSLKLISINISDFTQDTASILGVEHKSIRWRKPFLALTFRIMKDDELDPRRLECSACQGGHPHRPRSEQKMTLGNLGDLGGSPLTLGIGQVTLKVAGSHGNRRVFISQWPSPKQSPHVYNYITKIVHCHGRPLRGQPIFPERLSNVCYHFPPVSVFRDWHMSWLSIFDIKIWTRE